MFTQKFLVALLLAASLVSASVLRFGLDKRIKKRAPGDVITKCTVNNTVALTFDDGPYIWLNEIVDTLNAANAKGTFFFNGDNFGCIYDEAMTARVKYAYDHGHQMASHTWRHLHLNSLNEHQLHVEMWAVEEAIYRITGVYVAFTRPPFGEYNALVQQVAAARGQTLANWDFDSRDAAGASMAQTLGAYTSLIGSRPPTILTLNH
ncbi:hypothetical protein D9611_002082 [Ephemerocybe angulata]|uniref:NodB homology domain-containing protein n=1 Tax=Ephemerocybe angulata TaxID=980116 RepID=A0A8H5CHM9_9AGAR|nr:hypothetical protein D9611_002082 [Tulosesus angulatus]